MVSQLVGKAAALILNKISFLAWTLIHFLYQIVFEVQPWIKITWKRVKRSIFCCFPFYSTLGELKRFGQAARDLSRTPQHIAFIIVNHEHSGGAFQNLWTNLNILVKWRVEEDITEVRKVRGKWDAAAATTTTTPFDLHEVAKLVLWAWMAEIPNVTLYDYDGILKTNHRQLAHIIHEEIVQNMWCGNPRRAVPTLKFHNVPKTNGYTNGYSNGTNGIVEEPEELHIGLYSNEDGKAGIIRAAKSIYKERSTFLNLNTRSWDSLENSELEIKESVVNSKMNEVIGWSSIVERKSESGKGVKTEPDLLVILGNVKSTLGFLPWHLRLTEFHWLPPIEQVETSDLIPALEHYAKCEQRFGT